MGDAGAGAGEGYESVDAAEGPTTFGSRPFSADELHRIQQGLMKKLPRSCLSERSAGAGGKVSYIEGHRVIDHANQVLGFDGWSSSLLSLTQDYCDVNNERYSLCFTAIVRVQLKDGTFHEDVGCGLSEGQRSRGQALEKAKKEAVTDATKRALRYFGNYLGNSVYDRKHVQSERRRPTSATGANAITPAHANSSTPISTATAPAAQATAVVAPAPAMRGEARPVGSSGVPGGGGGPQRGQRPPPPSPGPSGPGHDPNRPNGAATIPNGSPHKQIAQQQQQQQFQQQRQQQFQQRPQQPQQQQQPAGRPNGGMVGAPAGAVAPGGPHPRSPQPRAGAGNGSAQPMPPRGQVPAQVQQQQQQQQQQGAGRGHMSPSVGGPGAGYRGPAGPHSGAMAKRPLQPAGQVGPGAATPNGKRAAPWQPPQGQQPQGQQPQPQQRQAQQAGGAGDLHGAAVASINQSRELFEMEEQMMADLTWSQMGLATEGEGDAAGRPAKRARA